MREYQVSFGKYVSKAELPALLKQLGYQGGVGGEGIILESVTTWYLKTGLSSNVTRETDPTEWKDYFTPPDLSQRYVWRYMDYWYTTNHHTPDFHVYTDCELVTMYSSGGGMGVEFAYALFDKDVSGVTVLNEGEGDIPDTSPSATWTKDLDTLIYNANQYLWMSQRIMDGETVGPWQKPIRISGKDGDPGADGLDTEFIYKLMGRKPNSNEPAPVTENPLVNRNKDDYYPESDGWNDCPQGVEDDGLHNFEWMSYRTLLTEDDPDYGTYKWSEFSTPIIWSAYGEKGMDGDGIEYVYKHVLDITNFEAPASPKFYATGGDIITWYGGVTLKNPGNPNNSNDWLPKDYNSSSGAFEYWIGGKYGPQGEWIPKIDPDGGNEDSNFWSDDPEGVGYFIRYQQNGQPVLDEDNNPVQDLYKYEYVTSRKRVNGEWGEFSDPKIWSTFSKEHTVEIGDDGYWWIDGKPTDVKAEGENGTGIDLKGKVDYYDADHRNQLISEGYEEDPNHIYTFLSDVEDTYNPEVGDCWVVTLNGHIYLYVGGDDDDWTKHWQDFGEFQGEGAYVHIAWAENITIVDGHVIPSGFRLDKNLSDNIAGLDWMGIYTDNKINDSDDADDYKWNYLRGRDGDNIERVYIRTAVEVVPEIEYTVGAEDVRVYPSYTIDGETKNYQSQEYLPFVANPANDDTANPPIVGCQPDEDAYIGSLGKFQFTDDPVGVTSTLPYEWMSERKKRDGEWKYFSTPSLHATYSHDGQSIVRSTIFRRWNSLDTAPQRPLRTLGSYEYPAGYPTDPDWSDGIPSGTGAIWKSERIFTSDGRAPQWDDWSIPTLVQDDDNYDVELSIQGRDDSPVPPVKYNEATTTDKCNSHHPAVGEEGYSADLIADQQLWFDPVDDAEYITEHNKNFNWMATRTKYVDSSGLPKWRSWTIVLIKGEDGGTGPAGIGFQHAYIVITGDGVPNIKVNPNDSTEFISDASGAVGTWQLDTTNGLSVGPNQYLWMAERTVQSGVYGLWGTPVKISGSGTPGEDAEDIEFVYKQENYLPNNTSQNSDKPGYDTYTDSNGKEQVYDHDDYIPQGWTDNPQGVDSDHKYEWMCQRIKPRTGEIVEPDHPWGEWSNVFVWSAYGDTGMDGDGVEYIFTVNDGLISSAPASPKYRVGNNNTEHNWSGEVINTAGDEETPIWKPKGEDLTATYTWVGGEYNLQGEWIPTGWTDEPHGVGYFDESGTEVLYSYEWVSIRKRINGEWKSFSSPSLWSNFSKRQTLTIGDDGYWYDEEGNQLGRAEGDAGKGIELKDTLDVKFNCDKQTYADANNIADSSTVKSLQDVHPISNTDTTSQYKDIAPGDCYVVKDTRHLYVCRHSKSNWDFTDNASTITNDTWDANKNWSDVGEFLGKGSYMHIAWAASKDPKSEIQGDNIVFNSDGTIKWIKYFVTAYEDKLPNVDYDWMGVYSDYEQLDPPSNFDLTANNGTTTDGKTLSSSLYKWNHVRGRDGDNYERVYIKSRSETNIPVIVTNNNDGVTYPDWEYPNPEDNTETITITYQDAEYLPAVAGYDSEKPQNDPEQLYSHPRFTDDPTGVSAAWPVEWMCERRKKLNTTTHQVEWFPFSAPALWAKYSFDGAAGKSIQTRYVAVPVKTGLAIDSSSSSALNPISTINGTPYSWQPNTSNYSSLSSGMYLWMTQRSTTDPNNDTTTEWEIPIRLSGEDGEPGKDGADIEFIYLRNNDATAPSTPANPTAKNGTKTVEYYGDVERISNVWTPTSWDTTNGNWSSSWSWINGSWNNDGEWIPTEWSDNPSGVDSTHKYEWACQRTKSSGNNQLWTQWIGPFKWSVYGDTGMDGDGVEYVYYRYQGSGTLNTPSGPKALTNVHSENGQGIDWNGGVYLSSSPQSPIESDDWLPKNWDIDGESWIGWDPNFGYYNQQGEWIPKVSFNNDSNPPSSPSHWSDDPLGVNKDNIREWVSVRKRINGEWGTFSPPQIWASHGTYVEIIGGYWYIDGVQYGKAEGEDGKGIALKGSVDFLTTKELTDYQTANPSDPNLNKLRSLQQIQRGDPNNLGITSVEIGDCYVVKKNRYLYTSKRRFDTDNNTTDDWSTANQNEVYWWETVGGSAGPGQNNWAEVGEFQGADGEGNYIHIAWAEDSSVTRNQETGEITLITPFIVDYAELDQDVVYDWMGVFSDENEDDPVDNYNNTNLGWDSTDPDTWNWKKYKWNHVKGRDGSDYERVYITTKTKDNPPTVNQNSYTGANNGHNDPTQSEFYPKVGNYSSTNYPGRYFTDDPIGVSAEYPYEWITERRKVLNQTTQRMEWGEFNSPATLWATYSFDGMEARLTRQHDSISIDAVGNVVGGYGDSSNPRIYTEVKIYDPKKKNTDNTFGGYLTYTDGTPTADQFTLSLSNITNCSASIITSGTHVGKIWISEVTNTGTDYNESSVDIIATLSSGKTFTFNFTVRLFHIPQTYLTYTLTNDSDTFTYRTKTKKYDGLPISTTLDVQTTDGTIDKLNDNTTTTSYVSSTKVVGIGDNNLLRWAKITKKDSTDSDITVSNKTVEVLATTNGTAVTQHKYTVTIYGDSNYNSITGLEMEVSSNGLVELKRSGLTTDLDLPDNTHNLNITSTAVLDEVTYQGLTKTFKLTEKNDVTLYKLVLSNDSFIKSEDGSSYSPLESTFSVLVNIIEESGTSTVSPSDLPNHIKVMYINGAGATSPGSDTLLDTRPDFSAVQNNFFTVLVVEFDGTAPIRYHDSETVDIVPPGASAAYIDVNYDKFYIDCDANGKITATGSSLVLGVQAYLRKGNLTCTEFTTKTITIENIGYNASTNVNYTSSPTSGVTTGSDGKISKTFTFINGKTLTTGRVKVTLAGTFSDGTTKSLAKYIDVIVNRKGDTGSPGDFKATAFIRTSTDISTWQPIGLNSSTNCPTGFSNNGTPANGGTWSDGIPAGDFQLWASTITVKGDGSTDTNTGWSLPREMTDTQYYDVEFSDTDVDPGNPDDNEANWFDPGSLEYRDCTSSYNHVYSGNWKDVYWRAEKECRNGVWDPEWTVLRIKGESEPNVKSSVSSKYIETDPTGKLSSDYMFSFKTWLYVAGVAQVTTTNTCDNPNSSVVKSIQRGTFNTTDNSITWTVTIKSGVVLSNVDLQITMANSTYTDSLTFPIIFINKNQSQVKSFVFKRFASQSAAEAGVLGSSVGSFSEPGPPTSNPTFIWNDWSDGLPSNGTDPIYMSSRLFTSDGLSPQQSSWSTPVKMSDTDNFNVEFSPDDSQPAVPVMYNEATTENKCNSHRPSSYTANIVTNQVWFDPVDDKYVTGTTPRDFTKMKWMATSTTKDSNGYWTNWVVVRIKGETGDPGPGIDEISSWYKAFDILDVEIPSSDFDVSDLENNGWANSYVKPTKDNPYLWKFTRTVYINPSNIVHDGLELVQIWSENMINPNLLDDTDFEPEDIRDNGVTSGTSLGGEDDSGGTMGAWRTWVVSNLKVWSSWGKNKGLSSSNLPPLGGSYYGGIAQSKDTTKEGFIVVLKQNIYNTTSGLNKVSAGNWYTLTFWARGSGEQYKGSTFHLQILSRNSSNGTIEGGTNEIIDIDAGITVNNHVVSSRTISFSYLANPTGYNNYGNAWKKYTITFKIKDIIPSEVVTSLLEWKLSSAIGNENGAGLFINKPKLEIGKVATDYISSSAIRDPYPRVTTWKIGQQYYQGSYGEPYLDIVGYGNLWFRCRNTHLSSTSNVPVIGQTTQYWEPAENFNFVVTDLLLAETAVIENLIVGGVRTGKMGDPHVEMEGSTIEFYGNFNFPSIKLDTDDDGVGILNFYDKYGSLLYNLGPGGFTHYDSFTSSWTGTIELKSLSPYYDQTLPGLRFLDAESTDMTTYYKWSEGYSSTTLVNNTKTYNYTIGWLETNNTRNTSFPSEYHNRYYNNKNTSTGAIAGYSSPAPEHPAGNKLSGWFIFQNNGRYESGGSTIDTGNGNLSLFHVTAYKYTDGKQVATTMIYFEKISGIWMDSLGNSKAGLDGDSTFLDFLEYDPESTP